MGLCMSSGNPKSSGIAQIALNSLDPSRARDERDRTARMKLRKRILGDIITIRDSISSGFLPNFGPQDGVDYGDHYRMIKIPADLLEELGQKFVRGLTYKLENARFITQMQSIEIYFAEDQKVKWVSNLIKNAGTKVCRGEGIEIERAVGDLERVGALYRITIWGRWTIYAAILPKE